MPSKKFLLAAGGGALATLALCAGALTFAQTVSPSSTTTGTQGNHQPGVMGTVTAVSGDTITLTGKNGQTYTINASSASITKDETVSVGDIKVGDTLGVQGSVSGTSVTASTIHDGQLPMGGGFGGRGPGGPGMMGRGVHGTITAISGNTLTVSATNPKDNTTTSYTVDATNAQVLLGDGQSKPTAGSLSSLKVGDEVMVAGSVSGTSVTAKMIIDGPMPKMQRGQKPANTTTTPTTSTTATQ